MYSAFRSGLVAAEVPYQCRRQRSMLPGCGNFGRSAEPAEVRVERSLERGARLAQRGLRPSVTPPAAGSGVKPRERRFQLLVLRSDLCAMAVVVLGHAPQQIAERGHAVARLLRKVGAAEEGRLLAGSQEHGQRPAAVALRDQLLRHLVDLIQVGTLFAIHLDVDEQSIHQRGGGGVLEGLVRHDMAPMAGRVADGQQNGLVLAAAPRAAPLRPRDTNRRDYRRAAGGTGWFLRQDDCAAC